MVVFEVQWESTLLAFFFNSYGLVCSWSLAFSASIACCYEILPRPKPTKPDVKMAPAKAEKAGLASEWGLRSKQPEGMALKEWSFTTRLWCNSNGWIDHVCRWFSALWRSVLCHLAGLKALQKRPAEAKGGSSENGRALAQGYSPSVAQSEDSFSSQGWSPNRSQVGDVQDRCTCCLKIYALPISREGLQPLETSNGQWFDSIFCHRHLLDLRRWAQRWRWMRSPLACQRVSCLQMCPGGHVFGWFKGWWLFMSFGVMQNIHILMKMRGG